MAAPPDYSFLVRPRWILSHLFVAAAVIGMVAAGFWQLQRHDERSDRNARIEARADQPAVPLAELLTEGPASGDAAVADATFRSVTVSGRYLAEQEVLVRNRTNEGIPGYWVLTPLVQADGTAVVVNRGWVPFATTSPDGPWDAFAPPTGAVTVQGMVQEPQVRGSGLVAGPTDAADGRLRTLSRVDVGRLQEQVDETLWPLYLNLRVQEPAQGDLPVPVPAPDPGDGPHLGYAGQWFIFATLTVVVYPLLLRRVARQRGAARAAAAGGGPPVARSSTEAPGAGAPG